MTDISEKHYSIDAGIGEKMDGCPYSLFEDGHDVQDYIIPPKGYVFNGFRFEPTDNQVYDGKLIAQYEKEPLKERMASVFHVLAWILIAGIIIGLITILTIGIFKPKKPHTRETKPETEITIPVADTLATENAEIDSPKDTFKTVEQVAENQTVTEENKPIVETPQPAVTDDNTLFKQAFWTLIHQRDMVMDSYDGLYKQYKGKVNGEEYDYLRFTVLKDYHSYKDWSAKLRKVPAKELESIETIDALKSKLKEIN